MSIKYRKIIYFKWHGYKYIKCKISLYLFLYYKYNYRQMLKVNKLLIVLI